MRSESDTMLIEEKARWDEDAACDYDTPGVGMFAPDLLSATVNLLKDLAWDGEALEFAVGTGRVAIPLHEAGVKVHGVELSEHMVARLREKISADELPVILDDMTAARLTERFSLVYIVYNSLSNLLTQEMQLACFENAARHLKSGGRFVVELWIPQINGLYSGQNSLLVRSEPGYFLVDTYDLSLQRCESHHIRFNEGKQANVFRSKHRYVYPAELDLMARLSGFTLEVRYANWRKDPFDSEASSGVSVYQKK